MENVNPSKSIAPNKKRVAAPEVKPVIYKGVKFIVSANMGYVEAWDVEPNKKIWEKKVYDVIIDPDLEADVQWVFIKSMRIVNNELVVINERENKFIIAIPEFKKNKQP